MKKSFIIFMGLLLTQLGFSQIQSTTIYPNIRAVKLEAAWGSSTYNCPQYVHYVDQNNSNGKPLTGYNYLGGTFCHQGDKNVIQAEFDHPSFMNSEIFSIKVKFSTEVGAYSGNEFELVALDSSCVNQSGTSEDIYQCVKGATDIISTELFLFAIGPTNFEIDVPKQWFDQNSTKFYIGIRGDDTRSCYITGLRCEITYGPNNGIPCATKGWWIDHLNISNNNMAERELATNSNGDVVYINDNDKIAILYETPNNDYATYELASHINYKVKSGLYHNSDIRIKSNLVVNSNDQIFFITESNAINCIYWNGTGWTVSDLNGASGFNCQGSLVINSNDQIFYRTTNNAINCVYWNGSRWTKSVLNNSSGFNCAGQLAVNSVDQVFFRTTNNAINCLYWTGSGWSKSVLNNSSGYNCRGALAVNSLDQVFFRTTNNAINCLYWTGSGWSKSVLNNSSGNDCHGDLCVNSNDQLFYRTDYNSVNCLYWTGSSWSKSTLTSGITTNGNFGLVTAGSTSHMVFYISDDNRVKNLYWGSVKRCDPLPPVSDPGMEPENYLPTLDHSLIYYEPYYELSDAPEVPLVFEETDYDESVKIGAISDGTFVISLPELSDYNYQVVDLQGKLLLEGVVIGSDQLSLDLSQYANGLLLLQVIGKQDKEVYWLMKR